MLGPLRLSRAGQELHAGPRQQQCMLALLLARGGAPVGLGELIELIWGDEAPSSAINVVHKYIGAVRRLLEPDLKARDQGQWLRRDARGYWLAAGPEVLDLATFRQLVSTARLLVRNGERGEGLNRFCEALQLWRGPAGINLADGVAAQAIFDSLDRERVDVAMEAGEVALREGQSTRMVPLLRQIAGLNRYDEPLHAVLIATLAAAGHQAEALVAFRTIQRRLADDLGIDVGAELQAVHQRVLRQEYAPEPSGPAPRPTLAVPAEAVPSLGDAEPVVRPAQLPPDLASFVGRDSELATLHRLLAARNRHGGSSPLIVAFAGMGGVGKSTLAIQFASAVADDFPDGQIYLDLRGHESGEHPLSTEAALRTLLQAFGVSGPQLPDTISSQIGLYRSLSAGKRILMLVDNARNADQIRPLLPRSAASMVLVTGRVTMLGLAATDGAHLLQIRLPDLAGARELMLRRLPALSTADGSAVDQIVQLCGRLPLALAIVAARMSVRPDLTPDDVVTELRTGAGQLDAFRGGNDLADPRTVFSWSYRHLSDGAARMFRFFSVMPDRPVSAAACASVVGVELSVARAQLHELCESALLLEDDGRFGTHVLVKAYAAELFRSAEIERERCDALRRLLEHYLHSSYHAQLALRPHGTMGRPAATRSDVCAERPLTYDESMAWYHRERRLLIYAVERAAELGLSEPAWKLMLSMQQYLQWRGYFHDWADVSRVALRAARAAGDRVGEAHALHSLAGARFHFAAYDEALEMLRSAQEIFTACGLTLQQGFVHTNVGEVLNLLGDSEAALAEHRRALELYRAAGIGRAQARALSDIGHVLGHRGDHERAAEALREALGLNQRLGNMHEVAEVHVDLAEVLVRLGRPEEAVEHLERGIENARLVGQLPVHFRASVNLAETWAAMGELARAQDAWHGASALSKRFQNGGTSNMREELQRVFRSLGPAADQETLSTAAGLSPRG